MRKKLLILLPVCVLLLAAVWALAAGDAADPLATLSYLTGTFTDAVDQRVDQRLNNADLPNSGGTASAVTASAWTETRLKNADDAVCSTGSSVLLLAGGAYVSYSSPGAVVDVTAGTVVPSGTALAVNHRYMAAEDTIAHFLVTSKTAVLDYQGTVEFSYSSAEDYNAMAAALKELHLFRGTLTGYGQGFDLEAAPTRLQALIMFIRVLGEEQQALAWTGTTPFRDVARGTEAEKYVGYAYERGYTNGYSATEFRPAGAVNASQYTEFVLRAMGYSSAANTNLADVFDRAMNAGVLTAGEASMLQRDRFLRAELVYISYYALDALLPNSSRTLADQLMDAGVFTAGEWESARGLVTSWRL